VENGSLQGHIEDQQGKFNLNNLIQDGKIDPYQLAHFQRLLATLNLAPALAESLADWIDEDSEPQPQAGAEDGYYLGLQSPYLAANRPLIDVAELALVRGYDSKVRARLRPFISALPFITPVNVNTASAEVLAAVIDELDLQGARALVVRRDRAYFRDYSEFLNQLPKGVIAASDKVAFASDYFLVQMRVSIGSAQARSTALLVRTDTGWTDVLWRKML
jgi:general secretion pathway protein K